MRDRPSPLPPSLSAPSQGHGLEWLPTAMLLSVGFNLLLLVAIGLLVRSGDRSTSADPHSPTPLTMIAPSPIVDWGPRHQLSYQQWVNLLAQEADALATQQPQQLTILLGDSISLWFPPHLLSAEQTWLNQGISGETTAGLLKRLTLFEHTQPDTILLMIGINDLIRGVDDATILRNYGAIVRHLKQAHPNSQLVVQSILPHGDGNAVWEGRDRLLALPNSRIQALNRKIEAIARQEQVEYLDLYPLFATAEGDLRPALSTDGLHLSEQGYLVWQTALTLYQGMK